MKPKIKICGLKDPTNTQDVLALRPDYIGFIFYPASKRFVGQPDELWLSGLEGVKKTGVFVDADIHQVQEIIQQYDFQAIQLHGSEPPAYCAALKKNGIEIIKAFGIHEDFDWAMLSPYQDVVDYFLFDTQSAQHGGTGVRFDWELLTGYQSDRPFFLSGGIGAENIADAFALGDNRLYALDLNSKFETAPGIKDVALLKKTLQSINDE